MRGTFLCFFCTIAFFSNAQEKAIFTKNDTTWVQIEAEFPGGRAGWAKYLTKKLNRDIASEYVKFPKKAKDTSVKVTAWVLFIINTDGSISEVEVENQKELHPKVAAEAIRVIKEGPLWTPAQQEYFISLPDKPVEQQIEEAMKRGIKKVKYRAKQAITWVVIP
jgi:hypothetical protein